jgi:uncharacterized membrane protein YkoI
MVEESITFEDVKKRIQEHLNIAIQDVKNCDITFAKLEKKPISSTNDEYIWRVNVMYKQPNKGTEKETTHPALFAINAKTGDVTQFEQGKYWTF